MNAVEITKILKRKCKIFRGTLAADELRQINVRQRGVYIVNTDPRAKPGEHWVVIYSDSRGRGEYFDSYGREPTDSIIRFMNASFREWTFNNKQLQSVLSTLCGKYCIMYCLYKCNGKSMNDMMKLFSNDTALNDYVVSRYVKRVI